MPLTRLATLLQNLNQFGRFILAWGLAVGVGVLVLLLSVIIKPTTLWYRLRTPWARLTLRLLRIRLEVTGQEHLVGPKIFIANHMSLIDVVVVPAIVPRGCRFVAKRELMFVPFWGWAFASAGALLIDRRNPRLAAKSLLEGLKKLPAGWSLVVFPEGTRSRTGALQRFKRGAFSLALASRMPMVPIGIAGTHAIIGPKQWFVRSGVVRVHVGPPLDTRTWQADTLRQHIQEGQDAVAACLQALGEPAHAPQVAEPCHVS
jgi:1-acyl-sn-glycerol-3-phosphate acyltransferase